MAKKARRRRRRLGQVLTVAYTPLFCTQENKSKLMTVIHQILRTTCVDKFPSCEGNRLVVTASCRTPGSAKLFKSGVERISRLIEEVGR